MIFQIKKKWWSIFRNLKDSFFITIVFWSLNLLKIRLGLKNFQPVFSTLGLNNFSVAFISGQKGLHFEISLDSLQLLQSICFTQKNNDSTPEDKHPSHFKMSDLSRKTIGSYLRPHSPMATQNQRHVVSVCFAKRVFRNWQFGKLKINSILLYILFPKKFLVGGKSFISAFQNCFWTYFSKIKRSLGLINCSALA